MPLLQDAFQRYSSQGLVVVAINVGEPTSLVQDFIRSQNYSFTVLLDGKGQVSGIYNVRAFPAFFFLNVDGTISEIRVGGWSSAKQLDASLAKIVR